MSRLADLLETVAVDEPIEAEGLQAFGLRWQSDPGFQYLTLDEALAAGTLKVTEISESGSVPVLRVTNSSPDMAFLMAGEHLIGAKQNRVLNTSLMVPGGKDTNVPVSCVEQGRWGYRSRHFGSASGSSHGILRKMMSKQVSGSYKARGLASSDQGAVWDEVERKLHVLGSRSGTSELAQAYTDHESPLKALVEKLKPPPGACGVVFAFGGRIAGCDLFDRPETLVKMWPKLVRAYAIDALERRDPAPPVTAAAVRELLRQTAQAKVESFKSAGLGEDLRLESPVLAGACLVVEEQPVHFEMFPE